jgi:hypothetical protein
MLIPGVYAFLIFKKNKDLSPVIQLLMEDVWQDAGKKKLGPIFVSGK